MFFTSKGGEGTRPPKYAPVPSRTDRPHSVTARVLQLIPSDHVPPLRWLLVVAGDGRLHSESVGMMDPGTGR